MGITHTFYEFNQQRNNIWINIGIAGHKTKKIGNILLVNKVTDIETKRIIIHLLLITAELNKSRV